MFLWVTGIGGMVLVFMLGKCTTHEITLGLQVPLVSNAVKDDPDDDEFVLVDSNELNQ